MIEDRCRSMPVSGMVDECGPMSVEEIARGRRRYAITGHEGVRW